MPALILFDEKPSYFKSRNVVFPESNISDLADRITNSIGGINTNYMELDEANYILYLGDETFNCEIHWNIEMFLPEQQLSN